MPSPSPGYNLPPIHKLNSVQIVIYSNYIRYYAVLFILQINQYTSVVRTQPLLRHNYCSDIITAQTYPTWIQSLPRYNLYIDTAVASKPSLTTYHNFCQLKAILWSIKTISLSSNIQISIFIAILPTTYFHLFPYLHIYCSQYILHSIAAYCTKQSRFKYNSINNFTP